MSKLDDVQYSENMIVSRRVTSKLISELESGKSSGPDNISPESLKFASNRLSVLLSLCFSVCLSHGYLPPAMIKTTIVPIVKNKCVNISESNNYRPIALATIISKLFESVLLVKCGDYLSTCSNQFGFKKGHSTDLCIYALKEYIEYFIIIIFLFFIFIHNKGINIHMTYNNNENKQSEIITLSLYL